MSLWPKTTLSPRDDGHDPEAVDDLVLGAAHVLRPPYSPDAVEEEAERHEGGRRSVRVGEGTVRRRLGVKSIALLNSLQTFLMIFTVCPTVCIKKQLYRKYNKMLNR